MDTNENADRDDQVSMPNLTRDPMISYQGAPGLRAKKLTVKERLDRLSKYRIRPVTIRATAEPQETGGGKAEVVRASFKPNKTACQQVGAKKLRFGDNTDKEKTSNEFLHEVEILVGLSHKNIVQLIGFVEDLEHDKAWIVLSWEPNGNVRQFLSSGKWEIPERMSLIQDTFAGLQYLHTRGPPIRHGDLKSLNILVSSSYRAIITDFGSARLLSNADNRGEDHDSSQTPKEVLATTEPVTHPEAAVRIVATANQLTLTGPAWSLRWAPPEVVDGKDHVGLASDIWSAGWVCWEIMTDELPFSELKSAVDITLNIVQQIDRSIPEDTELRHVTALWSLMTDCWKFEPKDRPDINQCYSTVKWMPSIPPVGATPSCTKASSTALLLEMGLMYHWQDNHDTAASLFQRALVSAGHSDDRGRAQALRGLGDVYSAQSKFSEAEECYKRAWNLFISVGDYNGGGHTLCGLGDVFYAQTKDTEAEVCYAQGRDILIRSGNYQGLAHTLRGLGDICCCQSKYSEAEGCYIQARDIYIGIGDVQGQANALQGLGDVYCCQSKHPEAAGCYTQAQDIFARIGDDQGRAHVLRGLGDVYRFQSKYPATEECYFKARDIYDRIGDELGRANSLHSLGDLHREQKRGIKAIEFYAEAGEIYAQIGNCELEDDAFYWLVMCQMSEEFVQSDTSYL
ncbi:hypothetical protein M407DRAFT_27345 [Tulasnella calospora MUT 4182]|uniref:Protein kinase domain-containing protein n=1 Tax=Tulasnella calospora MUT 4182 TaxID=1051891 RepID=A0A0C3LP40_9AGAM|nr:hypothetical protein M407DRAFT_27345 [Tulasnella calospora MUT 4182]